eukprot:NODE_344_length_9080_cov_0.340051.p3 type:complete len:328 gc:universal NODE_344_length_9080_cov_0.340051:7490-6507(-)
MQKFAHLVKNVPNDICSFLPNLDVFKHYFQGGKHIRPLQLILLSQCINQTYLPKQPLNDLNITKQQYKLALITEMIHTASLMHDDVLDQQDTRRNSPTIRKLHSDKSSILGGDYLLAKASEELSKMNTNVIALVASILMDLVMGELTQLNAHNLPNVLEKTKLKTASLFAKSSQAIAKLSDPIVIKASQVHEYLTEFNVLQSKDHGFDLKQGAYLLDEICYSFGNALGMSFQIKDDILDADEFEDGIINIPFILCANDQMWADFAMKENPDANLRIKHRIRTVGIPKSHELATHYMNISRALLRVFKNHECKLGLDHLCQYSVYRKE